MAEQACTCADRAYLAPTMISVCLLHLLIDVAIALAGMVADSNPLGSGRAPTGDAAEPSSPLHVTVQDKSRDIITRLTTFTFFIVVGCWAAMKVFYQQKFPNVW